MESLAPLSDSDPVDTFQYVRDNEKRYKETQIPILYLPLSNTTNSSQLNVLLIFNTILGTLIVVRLSLLLLSSIFKQNPKRTHSLCRCGDINRQIQVLFEIERVLCTLSGKRGRWMNWMVQRASQKFMFFLNRKDPENLGKNKETVLKLIDGKSEKQVVEVIMEKLRSLYGGNMITYRFLDFVKKLFSIMSWLFKHRFKAEK